LASSVRRQGVGLAIGLVCAVLLVAPLCARTPPHQPGDPCIPFGEGQAAERRGDFRGAIKSYTQSARWGYAKAAERAAEIYRDGVHGVPQNPKLSEQWHRLAQAIREWPERRTCDEQPTR
jgi:TPR repeat protein